MFCDAHVHMGYYPRIGYRIPFYYSPRRILGILNRCGVDEFIVSSTCAQIKDIHIADIIDEAKEMKRMAGDRAHVFFWLSWHLYEEDKELSWLDSGLFEGVKFHEIETPWVRKYPKQIDEILDRLEKFNMEAMFHCGYSEGCRPNELMQVARRHPMLRFDFAHCRPVHEMAEVVASCENVWTDTAYFSPNEFTILDHHDWYGRLMFGSDLPVWQSREQCNLTSRYRAGMKKWNEMFTERSSFDAFAGFTGQRTCRLTS